MSILLFIATQIVKPILIVLAYLSVTIAVLVITKKHRGKNKMKNLYTTREVRKLIQIFGKVETVKILARNGLTLKHYRII